jgi:signal transduction histidine kinase
MLTTGLVLLLGSVISAGDVAALPVSDITGYVIGRGAALAVFATYFLLAAAHRVPAHTPFSLFAAMVLYGAHGQLYRPDYWFIPVQFGPLFPLFYFVRFELLVAMYAVGFAIIDGIFLATADRYIAAGFYSREHVYNGIILTVIVLGVTLLAYNATIVLRHRKAQLYQRFFDLGKNFEHVMHDLKGMLSAPLVQAELVERGDPGAIAALRTDLDAIRHYIVRTNKLLYNDPTPQIVRIRESVDLVTTLIRSRLKSVEVECHGDLAVLASPEVINRILINAMVNSVEAIMRTEQVSGRIRVVCSGSTVEITDNSGTSLAPSALRRLNSPSDVFTDRPAEGGLGTVIIRDLVRSLDGRTTFSNGDRGIVLGITFPQKVIHGEAADPRG